MTAEVTEGQLQGREPTRQGKGDQKRETRQDRQQELRVARSGVSGRPVTCAIRNLEKTNIMALGAKGRAGMRQWDRSRNRKSDMHTSVSLSEVTSWSLQHGTSSPAGLMSVVARHGNKHFFEI